MIADKIKDIIKKKGLTSIEVSERLGVSRETFSRTINGNPTISTLKNIADVIGCEVGDFFNKSEQIIIKIKDKLYTFYSIEELREFINSDE